MTTCERNIKKRGLYTHLLDIHTAGIVHAPSFCGNAVAFGVIIFFWYAGNKMSRKASRDINVAFSEPAWQYYLVRGMRQILICI